MSNWLENYLLGNRIFTASLALIFLYLNGTGILNFSTEQTLVICIASTVLVGVAHGSVDHLILGDSIKGRFPLLISIYLLMTGVFVAVWFVAPSAALMLFLFISVVHFGFSDVDVEKVSDATKFWPEILLRGALPILLTCAFHTQTCAGMFAQLIGPSADASAIQHTLTSSCSFLFPVWICLAISCLIRILRSKKSAAFKRRYYLFLLESAALALCSIFLPVLISFSIYFCAGHSARQIFKLAHALDRSSPRRSLMTFCRCAAPIVVVTLVFGAGFFAIDVQDKIFFSAALRALFIPLSALTLPHLFVCFLDTIENERSVSIIDVQHVNSPT
jgi:beta-carotene 15,15'-dioxygenase